MKLIRESRNTSFDVRRWQLHVRMLPEEMAIAREDAHAQRQLMNVMMMAMLNRNGGENITQPQPPPRSPTNDD